MKKSMSKKNRFADQNKEAQPKSKRRLQIGVSLAVIAVALIIIFMPKKNTTETSGPAIAPMFKKEGGCTISNRDNKPIVSLDIEIADDDTRREIGLMGRPVMEERQGMLFLLEQEQIASFWMKNTILPLDMIFINRDGVIVTICRNTTPFSEQSYSATAMTLLVLEVNAGFTDKFGIKEGDRLSWNKL